MSLISFTLWLQVHLKNAQPLQEQRPHCVYICYKKQVPNCVSPKNQAGVTNISNMPWKCTTSSYWKGVKKDLSCSSLSSPLPTPHPKNLGNCDFFPYYFHARHALNSACERVHSFPAEQGVVLPERLALFSPSSLEK